MRFLGTRRDPLDLLAAFDVFVLPSVVEGMSNAVLEAMARSLPVVATDVGGIPEVVADGETGFIVPPGDPAALGAALSKLLQAPELAREMGAAGRSSSSSATGSATWSLRWSGCTTSSSARAA